MLVFFVFLVVPVVVLSIVVVVVVVLVVVVLVLVLVLVLKVLRIGTEERKTKYISKDVNWEGEESKLDWSIAHYNHSKQLFALMMITALCANINPPHVTSVQCVHCIAYCYM